LPQPKPVEEESTMTDNPNITNPSSVNRRQAIAGAGAAALALTGPALASVPKSDAELIRLGAEFDRLQAEWLPALSEWNHFYGVAHEAWKAKNIPFSEEEFFAVQDETGATAASDREDAALSSLEDIAEKIRELPAEGFAGLAVKLRVLRYDNFSNEDFDMPEKDMDWGPRAFYQFAAEIERMARA